MLRLLILFVFAVCIESQSQCLSTDSTYSTNINYTNAQVKLGKSRFSDLLQSKV